MSYEKLDRVSVIERLIEKRLTQREAARMLGLTSRQVRRLRRAYARGWKTDLDQDSPSLETVSMNLARLMLYRLIA
jgi:predicted transcriptional regulator